MDNLPWGIVIIAGPLLLALALAWALIRNRSTGPGAEARADRGARELRNRIDREDRAGGS